MPMADESGMKSPVTLISPGMDELTVAFESHDYLKKIIKYNEQKDNVILLNMLSTH
jgi:hypothetical protein